MSKDKTKQDAPPVLVKVKVEEHGMRKGSMILAKGAILNLTKAEAEALGDKVKQIGIA